ncbi:NAD(P)-binding protein [Trematosphaeria pertusa]|uniref:NAD(P)-binding protein n=1 Tax=Trematosphaeria pertusa TaxID=390896 RepID=A0A6A6IKG6_9PLEO|nr:NAD(P)-binding protein [Trematosphaeria pertusa]KAF2251105.1 NAD(P)-binding protein [Trematosphaeria pertusa]
MLNFGIIGTSWITHSFVECAHATGKWNLVAVYSRKEETAAEFAGKYEGRKVTLYTDLDDLAKDTNLQAVYIASPNILHYSHAKAMLSAGKHVILEKPSCSTSKELDELFKLSKEKGVFLIEAWRHIREANFKILKKSMEKLGQIYGASITYAQFSGRYDKVLKGETPNIFNLDMGGGALADLGVYTVAAAVDLFGAPKDAQYFPVIIRTGADGGGTLILHYDNFVVHLCGTKMWDSQAPSEIYGERGTLVVPMITDIEQVTFWDPRKKMREELGGPKEELNLKAEAEDFARIISEKDWDAAKRFETHSRETLKITEKVRRDNGLLFPVER